MADQKEQHEDYCERCGELREGKRRWMWHRWRVYHLQSPLNEEFYCFRCLRIMRVYSIIGLSLFAIIVAVIIAATIWANSQGSRP